MRTPFRDRVGSVRFRCLTPFILLASMMSAAAGQQSRAFQVDDLMELEQLGAVTVSPDGEWLAVVISRAMNGATAYRDFPFDVDRADIWLVARRGGERRNVTNGIADGSGYWNPVWSPDGKRLALLSTKGGDNIRPYVYDIASGSLRRLTERGADYLQAVGDDGWPGYGMIWSGSTTLICPVRAEGAPPSYYLMSKLRSYSIAGREWAKATKGVEPTASVLESGREIPGAERPQGALLAINVVSGRSRTLAKGNVRRILVSPTHQKLAVIFEAGRIPPQPFRKVPYGDHLYDLLRTRLTIVNLEPDAKAIEVGGVVDPKLTWGDSPHSWSPDGSSLAVIGKENREDESAITLSLVSAATGNVRRVADRDLEVAASAWSSGGDLLAFARPRPRVLTDPDTVRFDWWAIGQQGSGGARKLTAKLKVVPATVFRTPDPHRVVGLASGSLWALDVRSGGLQNLTHGAQTDMETQVWPTDARSRTLQDLVVETSQGELYRVRWKDRGTQVTLLPRPSKSAQLAAFLPERQLAAFTAATSNGAFLWTGDDGSEHFQRRMALNEQLGDIKDPKRILITYRGVEGDTLKGLLILPVDYREGHRYPLIAFVHAGPVVTDTILRSFPRYEKYFVSSLNLQLLTGHGYAVLIPSMPLAPAGQASDPWIDLPKGVIAAVDKVIDLGIADPERLGVMGQSYGGYSTYALVTYTNRFKAAVALAGLTDLPSIYGTYFAPLRYDAYVHEDLFSAALAESGQTRMGEPPWRDLWRYIRNSPVYYADRVQTPLMIIQGDMDYVPIQQGEEFFTALYRQGKEAQFVRYWGEGHVVTSPANIRDMWQRIFAWFDGHLKGQTSTPRATAPTIVGSP